MGSGEEEKDLKILGGKKKPTTNKKREVEKEIIDGGVKDKKKCEKR